MENKEEILNKVNDLKSNNFNYSEEKLREAVDLLNNNFKGLFYKFTNYQKEIEYHKIRNFYFVYNSIREVSFKFSSSIDHHYFLDNEFKTDFKIVPYSSKYNEENLYNNFKFISEKEYDESFSEFKNNLNS